MRRSTQPLHSNLFETINTLVNKPDFSANIIASDFDYRFVLKKISRFEYDLILRVNHFAFSHGAILHRNCIESCLTTKLRSLRGQVLLYRRMLSL